MKNLLLLFSFLFLQITFSNAQYVVKSTHILNPDLNIDYVKKNAQFWIDHAYDPIKGGFFSDIDVAGNKTQQTNVHTQAKYYRKSLIVQARHEYGFTRAFMLTGDESYLTYAKSAHDFLTTYGWDTTNDGWFCFAKEDGSLDDGGWWNPNTYKWGFQQHYGMVGIVANYEATRNTDVKTWMDKGINSLYTHLWDATPGQEGYFANDNGTVNWGGKSGKGFTPTVDGITTNAELTYLITKEPAHKARLLQLADNIVQKIVPAMDITAVKAMFPETFNTNWSVTSGYPGSGSVGHFIKTAWCLGRAFLCEPTKSEYKDGVIKIMDEAWTYKNGTSSIWDHVNGAPFTTVNIQTGIVSDNKKDYWTLEQGYTSGMLNYYITKNPNYLQMADESLDFFMKYMVDNVNGEIYMGTSADGKTVTNNTKGEPFKGSYHSNELGYYAYLYSNLYYLHQPASLYYKFAASTETQNISLSPIPMEEGLLRIKSVTLDGNEFTTFDPATRTLNIAANQGGKFKVTFESLLSAPAAVASLENNKITIYPNPTTDYIQIDGMEAVNGLVVMDLAGKVLIQQTINGQSFIHISLKDLNAGIYFVVLHKNSGEKIMRKIIKQ
jgi:mannobiose 2-epimerase